MDPRKLFADERFSGFCVFCGGAPETRDHCPSRVLLDEPFPPNVPVVDACTNCNNSFSSDELYVACFLEAVVCGSSDPAHVSRANIKRLLAENPELAARINQSHRVCGSDIVWEAEVERVRKIVLKLARGHMAYEMSLPKIEQPSSLGFVPLQSLSDEQRAEFESPDDGSVALWPELGSRAFVRAATQFASPPLNQWIVVQPGRYRYFVSQSQGDFVHMVLSEYLACRVVWQ